MMKMNSTTDIVLDAIAQLKSYGEEECEKSLPLDVQVRLLKRRIDVIEDIIKSFKDKWIA